MSAHASNALPLGEPEHPVADPTHDDRRWLASVASELVSTPTFDADAAPIRVGAIDVDGIATRMLVADVQDGASGATMTTVKRRAAVTALDARGGDRHRFDRTAIARTIDVIAHFHQTARATGAVETLLHVPIDLLESPDWRTMRFEIEQRLRHPVSTVSGDVVGSGDNVADLIEYADGDVGWLIDSGSASADVVVSDRHEPLAHHRFPAGFHRSLEHLLGHGSPPAPAAVVAAYQRVLDQLEERFPPGSFDGSTVGLACNLADLGDWLDGLPHVEHDPATAVIELDRLSRQTIAEARRSDAGARSGTLEGGSTTLPSLIVMESAMRHFGLVALVTRREDVLERIALEAVHLVARDAHPHHRRRIRPPLRLVETPRLQERPAPAELRTADAHASPAATTRPEAPATGPQVAHQPPHLYVVPPQPWPPAYPAHATYYAQQPPLYAAPPHLQQALAAPPYPLERGHTEQVVFSHLAPQPPPVEPPTQQSAPEPSEQTMPSTRVAPEPSAPPTPLTHAAPQPESVGDDRPARPMRTGLRWVRRVLGVLIVLNLLVITALTWGTHVTRFRSYVILGKSMEPTIPLGSVIVGEPVPRNTIHKGDIITYSRPDRTNERVTHRVVKIQTVDGRKIFRTKGDNNRTVDSWTADYMGKEAWRVRWHVPYVGWELLALQAKTGRIAVIVGPAMFLFALFVRWLWSEDDDPTGPVPHGQTIASS